MDLYLKLDGEKKGEVVIQLDQMDPSTVRSVLIERIDEAKGKMEPLTALILRMFKL